MTQQEEGGKGIKGFVKSNWPSILVTSILGTIAVIIFFFLDAVEYYTTDFFILPRVKERLKDEGFLREEIAEGKFIVVDSIEFAKNNPINDEYIKKLGEGVYLEKGDPSRVPSSVTSLKEEVEELSNKVSTVQEIQGAQIKGHIQVDVFSSKDNNDENILALNLENSAISSLLRNGSYYEIKPERGKKICVKVRLDRGMRLYGNKTKKPVGRMGTQKFDKLFKGSSGKNLGKASIYLQERPSCDEV